MVKRKEVEMVKRKDRKKRRWQGPWPFKLFTKPNVERHERELQKWLWEWLRNRRKTKVTLPIVGEDGCNVSMPKGKIDLFDWIKQCTHFRYDHVVTWIRRIAENVRAVHAAKVAHLDIKPENILIMPDGDVRIIDWGLAVKGGAKLNITHENMYTGTPPYNYYRSTNDTGRTTDMYAVGVTCYALCVGLFPSPELHDKHGQDLVAAIVSKFHAGKYRDDFKTR